MFGQLSQMNQKMIIGHLDKLTKLEYLSTEIRKSNKIKIQFC